MEPVLEGRDDPEVAAAAAQAPEQVGVLALARGHEAAVGGDDVRRDQVVAGKAVLALEPADAAAERQARDAGARDGAAGGREAERLRLAVELAPRQARLRAHGARLRVDADPLQGREVDHQAAVAQGLPGDVVAAAPYRQLETLGEAEAERGLDVRDTRAARDRGGPLVDHRVVERARRVVVRIARGDHDSAQLRTQFGQDALVLRGGSRHLPGSRVG